MKAAFYTLGCKCNQFETQAMERMFLEHGHEIVPFAGVADVYVINTCTVTALSDKKSRNAARRCRKYNPNAIVIVCGCYAQVKPEEAKEACGADFVLGTSEKSKVLQVAEEHVCPPVPDLWHGERPGFDLMPAGGLQGRTRALLKVQDGCQNFCTYCKIPFARGPSRSMPLELAVQEGRRLMLEGYGELVVTGIEISSYGTDLEGKPDLGLLLANLCAMAPEIRVRLGSLEPRTINDGFAALCKMLPNLCPHFHLSLQSGCDKTLKAMGRRYDTKRFAESVKYLRHYLPNCSITTDLIVGFPGETEEDFEASLAFVEECKLSQVHIFPYSRRIGTRAHSMPNQVPNAEKERRAAKAAEVCDRLHREYLESLVGLERDVLFEQQDEDGLWSGYCPEYALVRASGENLHNQIRKTKIVGVENGALKGEVIYEW